MCLINHDRHWYEVFCSFALEAECFAPNHPIIVLRHTKVIWDIIVLISFEYYDSLKSCLPAISYYLRILRFQIIIFGRSTICISNIFYLVVKTHYVPFSIFIKFLFFTTTMLCEIYAYVCYCFLKYRKQ